MNSYVVADGPVRDSFEAIVLPIRTTEEVRALRRFSLRKVMRSGALAWQLAAALVRQRPEACYFSPGLLGFALYRDLVLVLLLKLFGVRRVYHLHVRGLAPAVARRGWRGRAYRWVFADAKVILITSLVYQDIEALVPRERVRFVQNGIPENPAAAAGLAQQRAKEPPTILFLSNMTEEKGPLVLLEAVTRLRDAGKAFKAVFAGPWKEAATRERFQGWVSQHRLEGAVTHLGPIYGDDKTRVLSEADIFAFPTFYSTEISPLVVMEAMSFGLAIVTTREGGIPDLIDDRKTGLFVRSRDPEALAEVLATLLDDAAMRRTLGGNARAAFEAGYRVDRFQARLRDTLAELIEA
jgi:glycosyltransferase involved in cell wall biosynthesis